MIFHVYSVIQKDLFCTQINTDLTDNLDWSSGMAINNLGL